MKIRDEKAFLADLDAKGIPYTLGPPVMRPQMEKTALGDDGDAYNRCSRAGATNTLPGHFTTPVEGVMQGQYTAFLANAMSVDPESIVASCVHEGEPHGKQRPRISRGHIYTPKETKDREKELASLVLAQIPQEQQYESEWAYGIRATFYVGSHQRKDVDNMLKLVLDALNGLAFKDDAQVHEVMGWKHLDLARPRTEFVVYRMHKIDKDIGQCVKCGVVFRRYKSWKSRLYCSKKCFGISIQKKLPCTCCHCGKEFYRTPLEIERVKGEKLYCSSHCKGKHNRMEVLCAACGVTISRPNSLAKPNQEKFYCSRICGAKARTGKPLNATPKALSERSLKAWVTRRTKCKPGVGLLIEGVTMED